jgi:predicted permease
MRLLLDTLRYAARRLVRAPAFTATTVLTLAFGIGATTTMFSVVDGVLLRPLPYADADRLVDLAHELQVSGAMHVDQSDASFLFYQRENRVFAGVGAYQSAAVNLGGLAATGSDVSETVRVSAARVSASLFEVLRTPPARGRAFADRDDQPGAAPVVIISDRLWARRFDRDPRVVGQNIRIDGVAYQLIGVMPARLAFPEAETDLWLASGIDPAKTESATFDYRGVARLRAGVTIAEAEADLRRLLPLLPQAFPGRLTAGAIAVTHMHPVLRPLRDVVVGDVGRVLWIALGAVAFVLLAACANVSNLFLARAEARWHEIAVRRALGAGRGAVMTECLSEGLVVAVLGGALGLAVAAAGVGALRLFAQFAGSAALPRLAEVSLDGAAVAVATALTAVTALLVSAIMALRALAPARLALSSESRSATAGRERLRARHVLVVSQVALALVLLAGAGLMWRSFARLRVVPSGIVADGVATFRVALPEAAYPTSIDLARYYVRALDAIAALPGVAAAGVVTKLPFDEEGRSDTAAFVEDRPLGMGGMPNIHQVQSVTPSYFAAMGIPIVAGRLFERPEPGRAVLEVIVSQSVAKRYWPGADAIGRRLKTAPTSPWSTVVGVAGDIRSTALERPPDEILYVPLVAAAGAGVGAGAAAGGTSVPRTVAFAIRARGERTSEAALALATGKAVRAIDPAVATYKIRPMSELLSRASARTSSTLALLGIAAASTVALAAVGIFGLIAYGVSRRGRELGIRLALGARPSQLRVMVSRQALTLCGFGVIAGLAGAVALTRVLGALLFETSPTDPVGLGGAALVLLGISLAASWAPARRAARADPSSALRAE